MIRITLCVCYVASLIPNLVLAASLEDYQSRLQMGVKMLRSATAQERTAALDKLVRIIPSEEEVTVGTQAIKVNNAWIGQLGSSFARQTDLTKRQAIYLEIQGRLAALLDQVERARQATGGTTEHERRQLAGILDRREFQRHRHDTWMSRLRHWFGENMARLVKLVPGWQRGDSPLSRLLEMCVWIMAAAVVYFLGKSAVGGFRREKRIKPSGRQIILGTIIEPEARPGDVREQALALAQQGDYRGAIRHLYIALLYDMKERGVLQLEAGATNGEYLRRLRSTATIYPLMLYLTRRFDQVWYGNASPSEPEYHHFLDQYRGALSALENPSP
jgi:hypothetical protein